MRLIHNCLSAICLLDCLTFAHFLIIEGTTVPPNFVRKEGPYVHLVPSAIFCKKQPSRRPDQKAFNHFRVDLPYGKLCHTRTYLRGTQVLRSASYKRVFTPYVTMHDHSLLEAHVMPGGDKSFHLNNTALLTFDDGRTYCQAKGGALALCRNKQ